MRMDAHQAVISAANQIACANGAAHIADVMHHLTVKSNLSLPYSTIQEILAGHGNVRWLDDARNWLWLGAR